MADAAVLQFFGRLAQSRPLAENGACVSDETRFETFYESTRKPLYGYLFRIVSDTALAQDLFQETYLRFLKAERKPMDDATQRAYLFRIAANLVNDHFRKHKRERAGMTELLTEASEVPDVPADPRPVNKALEQLSKQNKALLWLAYVEQFDHITIAEMLGVQKGSVRVLLFRAKQKMLSLLSGEIDKS